MRLFILTVGIQCSGDMRCRCSFSAVPVPPRPIFMSVQISCHTTNTRTFTTNQGRTAWAPWARSLAARCSPTCRKMHAPKQMAHGVSHTLMRLHRPRPAPLAGCLCSKWTTQTALLIEFWAVR